MEYTEQAEKQAIEAVEKVAEVMAEICFVREYKKPENLDDRKEQGLGMAVSKWSKWDGVKIMRVFQAALKDANFYDESEKVEQMIADCEKEFEEEEKRYIEEQQALGLL